MHCLQNYTIENSKLSTNSSFQSSALSTKLFYWNLGIVHKILSFKTQHCLQNYLIENSALSPKLWSVSNQQNFFSHLDRYQQKIKIQYFDTWYLFSSFKDLDPDTHGSALIWLSWIRIQKQGNRPKLTNKAEFKPLKSIFLPT